MHKNKTKSLINIEIVLDFMMDLTIDFIFNSQRKPKDS